MSKLDDWKIYLEDPDAFDMDHFAQSLTDESDEYRISPQMMFSFSDKTSEVVSRIEELKNRTHFTGLYYVPKDDEIKSESKLLDLFEKHKNNVSDFLQDEKKVEDLDEFMNSKVEVERDDAAFQAALEKGDSVFSPALSNMNRIFDRLYCRSDERYYAAIEAVLSMTNDFGVTNHIINGSGKVSLDFRPAFDFYIGGGDFAHFSDRVLVFCPPGR